MHLGKKNLHQGQASAGFSTLEILLAMTIVTVSLATILLVLFGSQSLATDSQRNVEAVNKAQEMLENQQALARKDFNLVNANSTVDGVYQKSISVVQRDFYTKEVLATITWLGEYNRPQTVSLSALVTNYQNVIGGNTCSSVLVGDYSAPQTPSASMGALLGDPTGTYPISGMDAYQGKLYVTVSTSSQATAATSPSVGTNDSSFGSIGWLTASNITSTNNVRATADMFNGDITNYLKATNFGFNIPAGATIIGIKVDIERSINGSTLGGVRDREIKIIKSSGAISSNNLADTSTNWPVLNSEGYATYNPSNLWGEAWSNADINSSNFGVAIAAAATASRRANVDHVKITVTYVKSFYIFDLTNPLNPVFISGLGSNSAIATGLNAVATDGVYAYVATNSTVKQLQALSTTTPSTVVATYSVSGDGKGDSIFYKNGYIFLGSTISSGPEFNIIDASKFVNGQPGLLVGSYEVGNTVNSIYIKGNYAYLATANNSEELVVLDITNPASPKHVPTPPAVSYNAPAGAAASGYGERLYPVGDTLYFGRSVIAGNPELYILDNTFPVNLAGNNLTPATYEVGKTINGLIVRDSLAFLLTGSTATGGNLRILNIANPLSITEVPPPVIWPNGAGGTALDCEGNYVYVSSVDSGYLGYLTVVTGD